MKEGVTHKKLIEGKSCVALGDLSRRSHWRRAKQDKPKSEHPNDEKTKRTQIDRLSLSFRPPSRNPVLRNKPKVGEASVLHNIENAKQSQIKPIFLMRLPYKFYLILDRFNLQLTVIIK
jgi:hypothetical protein